MLSSPLVPGPPDSGFIPLLVWTVHSRSVIDSGIPGRIIHPTPSLMVSLEDLGRTPFPLVLSCLKKKKFLTRRPQGLSPYSPSPIFSVTGDPLVSPPLPTGLNVYLVKRIESWLVMVGSPLPLRLYPLCLGTEPLDSDPSEPPRPPFPLDWTLISRMFPPVPTVSRLRSYSRN